MLYKLINLVREVIKSIRLRWVGVLKVKLAIDSVVARFRPGALVKSDRKLVFIDCKLVLKASRYYFRGFWIK
jgi:hypothetical protein